MRKKLLALLLAAALALSLLAGCGGESVASALLKLLEGRYPNISIEIDPDLEADLRQAIRKAEAENAGDDAAVIRAALETALGSTITFRYLGDGQKGETAFDLVFYAGSDPDKAAQAAYSQWNATFSNVPADGKYDTSLAMVETNSGVWMLVKATVEKAGRTDKPDKDDDEPETQEPKDPYTDNGDNSYTVNTKDGLQKLFKEKNSIFTATTVIKLTADTEYTVNTDDAPLAATFEGTLTCDGGKAKIELSGDYGLFKQIATGGTVENININVKDDISEGYVTGMDYSWVGPVAGENKGTIRNCKVNLTNITITGDSAGGIVGWNADGGEISGCTVTGGAITTTDASDAYASNAHAGGIAGLNNNGTIGTAVADCTVNGTCVFANSSSNAFAGGLVGYNFGDTSAVVNGSYEGNGTISATSTGAFAQAGGLVGHNSRFYGSAEVSGSYNGKGTISATTKGTDVLCGANAGGLVGHNSGTVTATYTGDASITAKAGSNEPVNPSTSDQTGPAYAGTGIGNNNGNGPVSAEELPWPKP